MLAFVCPRFAFFFLSTLLFALLAPSQRAQSEEDPADEKPDTSAESVVIEEVVVTGQSLALLTEMDPETEQLLNIAGAGLDPLAAALSLPGVTFASDYSSEPAVRGSAPNDNNYYIDFMPVEYVFHLFGNSIFNQDLIHSFDLLPAAFSSQYSNATGAIIDVRLRDPRAEPPTVTLDASFLSAGLLLESGIGDDQAFYFSYRRSLFDQFVSEPEDIDENSGVTIKQLPIAEDYQSKYRWELNPQNRITLLATGARDTAEATFQRNSNMVMRDPDFAGPATIATEFHSQALAWDRLSDDSEHSSHFVLSETSARDDMRYGTGQYLDITTDTQLLRGQLNLNAGEKHQWTAGGWLEATDFDLQLNAKVPACSSLDVACPTVDAPLIQFSDSFTMNSQVLFLEDLWQITNSFSLRAGVHYLADDHLDQRNTEPRLRMEWDVNDRWQIHAAYGHYSQLPQANELAPGIGNPELRHIESVHSALGVEQTFGNQWSWMAEIYHKELDKLPLSLSPLHDADFAARYSNDASGKAYGLELLINKKLSDKFYGWLALSLSQTERHNERTGETRDFDYDKPVILNWVMNYQATEHWSLGLKWSVQSGALYTPVTGVRSSSNYPEVQQRVYGQPNSERLPYYHRLDLRTDYSRDTGYGMWSVFVDLLNAYDSKNVQGVSSTPDSFGDNITESRAEGLDFFPSLGFKVQF